MSVKLLFIITETFFVKGRGIILAPGISNIKQKGIEIWYEIV